MEAAPNSKIVREHDEGRILYVCRECGFKGMDESRADAHQCPSIPLDPRQQRRNFREQVKETALFHAPENEEYTTDWFDLNGRCVVLRTPTAQAAPGERIVYECPSCGQLDGCPFTAFSHQQEDHPQQPQDNSSADEPSAEARGLPSCCICCTGVSDVVFFPCKHVATCCRCMRILQQRQNPRCPICKLAIMGTETVKFSCAVSG